MAEQLQLYRVVRRHEGDRVYEEGSTRELLPSEAAHLVPLCLVPILAESVTAIEPVPEPAAAPEPTPARKAKVKGRRAA